MAFLVSCQGGMTQRHLDWFCQGFMFLITISIIIHYVDCKHGASDVVTLAVIIHEMTKIVVVGEADTERVAGLGDHWKFNTDPTTRPPAGDLLVLLPHPPHPLLDDQHGYSVQIDLCLGTRL